MKNVLLVFGGESYEHYISIVTASQIFNRTKLENYTLNLFYITKEGKYYIYNSDEFKISDFSDDKKLKNRKLFKEVVFVSSEKGIVFVKTKFGIKEYLKVDLAIFACHGGDGENGKTISIFEHYGIYASAGCFDSLAVCMNKFLFKQVMISLKIPTIFGDEITKNDFYLKNSEVLERVNKIGYPLILKPNNGGSSIGLFIAEDEQDFKSKFEECLEFDNVVLVEKYIKNTREFNIALMGDSDEFEVSDIDEPLKEHEVLTFADKYLSNDSPKSFKVKGSMESGFRNFPANIPESLTKKIKSFASKIFKKLDLRGVVRIDFLFDEDKAKLYVCEVNAIPGSLAYYFFNNNQMIINDFVLKLINLAEKYKDNVFFVNKEYITNILV